MRTGQLPYKQLIFLNLPLNPPPEYGLIEAFSE